MNFWSAEEASLFEITELALCSGAPEARPWRRIRGQTELPGGGRQLGDADLHFPVWPQVCHRLFGEAAEKKEVDAIANSGNVETRETKSYNTFELLASSTTFVPHINTLIVPLHAAALAAGKLQCLAIIQFMAWKAYVFIPS